MNHWLEKSSIIIKYIIMLLLFSLSSYIILFQFNYLQIDIAWHIASAKMLWTTWFHNFNDWWFLWYIQNLFYPPLEDILVWIFSGFWKFDFILWYKIYIFVLIMIYIWSIFRLDNFIKNPISKIIFYIFSFYFLIMEKEFIILYQWMWLFDIFITWFSAEILWWIFLFLVIYELFKEKQSHLITIYLFFWIISHLVVWPLIVGILLLFVIFEKRYYLIKNIIIWIWLSSFFLLPFLLNNSWLTVKSSFYAPKLSTVIFFLLLLISIFLLLLKTKTIRIFILSWILFLIPSLFYLAWYKDLLPNFHYYRLIIFSVYFLILWFVFLIETKSNNELYNFCKSCIYLVITFFILTNTTIHYFNFSDTSKDIYYKYWKINLNDEEMSDFNNKINDKSKRILFLSDQRQLDFYLWSLFIAKWYDLNWVKWLYWESSLNNLFLNNYIANVLNPYCLVLDKYMIWESDKLKCNDMFNLFENWVIDNNIWYVLLKDSDKLNSTMFITKKQIDCLWNNFNKKDWKFNYKFIKKYNFDDNLNNWYNLIEISKKDNNFSNDIIQIYTDFSVKNADENKNGFYIKYFQNILKNNSNSDIYLLNKDYNKFINNDFDFKKINQDNIKSSFEKINTNKYKINIDSNSDVYFKIKLSFYNWFKLYDKNNTQLPIYNWIMWIYSYWKWEMYLEYKKPIIFNISYLLSIIFLIIFIIDIFALNKIKKLLYRLN